MYTRNNFEVIITALLFFATPVAVIIGIILSVFFRRRKKLVLSIMVQFAPIITVLSAFLIMGAGLPIFN